MHCHKIKSKFMRQNKIRCIFCSHPYDITANLKLLRQRVSSTFLEFEFLMQFLDFGARERTYVERNLAISDIFFSVGGKKGKGKRGE